MAQSSKLKAHRYKGVIDRYKKYLPVTNKTPVITLFEGNTPLIKAEYLSKFLGKGFEVYLKYEGLNPTGSFKDRGMTMAMSGRLQITGDIGLAMQLKSLFPNIVER